MGIMMYDISLIAKFRCLGFDAWRFEGGGGHVHTAPYTPLNSLVPEPKIHPTYFFHCRYLMPFLNSNYYKKNHKVKALQFLYPLYLIITL